MRILTTDADRFRELPDYPFAPRFLKVGACDPDTPLNDKSLPGLAMHYADEGQPQAPVVLMLHGEHGWSYLYRRMIPLVTAAGFRVVAPDLIGFGRSDKPAEQKDYSFSNHLRWLLSWLRKLDLQDITLVCQNRSSLLGLALVARQPQRFSRIVTANACIPCEAAAESHLATLWKGFARYSPWFPVSGLIQLGTSRPLSRAERKAYDAPFPTDEYKAGARSFAHALSLDPEQVNIFSLWRFLEHWNKPFITCFSDSDPTTRGAERLLQRRIPGAFGQPHLTIRGGHFLQEDAPEAFARVIIDAGRNTLAA